MLERSFSLLFYLKKPKNYVGGPVPIYLRITVNGQPKELSIKRECEPERWSSLMQRGKGTKEDIKSLNAFLDTLALKVHESRRKLVESEKMYTADTLKSALLGQEEKPRMVLEVFQHHNDQMETLVDTEYSSGTLERYKTSLSLTRLFLKWKYKVSDMDIKSLNFEFVSEYEYWLKSVRKCNHNTTIKYIANFRKIVNRCIRNGWLLRDPFVGFKMTKKEVDRTALTDTELQQIASKQFVTPRLAQVRDIFLFCCFTGLAYIDIKQLKRSEIGIGVDGEKWIFTSRQKTEMATRIPLLPITLEIMDRYNDHPQCCDNDRVLPVLSNQKMNAYLKEIADVSGINKSLTFHIARHTFATTVCLSNSVPFETVSKMLGHTNLRTTQIYAKVLDGKVSDDMKLLKAKLAR